MNVHEMTVAALMEGGQPAVAAALQAVGPTRAGDPPVGLFGWLDREERVALGKAMMLSHDAAGNEVGSESPEEFASWVRSEGSWRSEMMREQVVKAFAAYTDAGGTLC